jgi:dynein heavy chain
VVLEPISVSERQEELSNNTEKDNTKPREMDKQKRGIFSEFLQQGKDATLKIHFKEDIQPLPAIGTGKYVAALPVSNTFKVELAKSQNSNSNTLNLSRKEIKKPGPNEAIINYRKAVEPKVMLPFVTRPNETPRKIDIERKKREYSSKDIKQLIQNELDALKVAGLLPLNSHHSKVQLEKEFQQQGEAESDGQKELVNNDVSHLLPLEIFDNTDYDQRTADDWLNMSLIPDTEDPDKSVDRKKRSGVVKEGCDGIRFAQVPLPAKAFDGLEWRDCLVIAYDDLNGQWKVKWRSYNGWELDKKSDGNSRFVHPEDEGLLEELDSFDGNPRDMIDGKELWVNRYWYLI